MDLASSSERLWVAGPRFTSPESAMSLNPPLLRFVRSCPSADVTVMRPLPAKIRITRAETLTIPCDSDLRQHAATRLLVPSSWFLTTSTVCYAWRLQVFCNLYRPGFAALLALPTPTTWQAKVRRHEWSAVPAARAPYEELPRRQPVTPLDASLTPSRLPPSQCGPEGRTCLIGPPRGVTPSTTLDRITPRCRFVLWPSSFHGLLYLQRFWNRSPVHPQDV